MTEGWAVAFSRAHAATPALLAVVGACDLAPRRLLSLVRWASELSALSAAVHPAVRVSSASWTGVRPVVTWRGENIAYAAVCNDLRAAAPLCEAVTLHLAAAAGRRMASYG